jgi:hypothetical protein
MRGVRIQGTIQLDFTIEFLHAEAEEDSVIQFEEIHSDHEADDDDLPQFGDDLSEPDDELPELDTQSVSSDATLAPEPASRHRSRSRSSVHPQTTANDAADHANDGPADEDYIEFDSHSLSSFTALTRTRNTHRSRSRSPRRRAPTAPKSETSDRQDSRTPGTAAPGSAHVPAEPESDENETLTRRLREAGISYNKATLGSHTIEDPHDDEETEREASRYDGAPPTPPADEILPEDLFAPITRTVCAEDRFATVPEVNPFAQDCDWSANNRLTNRTDTNHRTGYPGTPHPAGPSAPAQASTTRHTDARVKTEPPADPDTTDQH